MAIVEKGGEKVATKESVIQICDRGCLSKTSDTSCRMRLDKGVKRARKSGCCKFYKNADTTFNKNKATCEKTCKQ